MNANRIARIRAMAHSYRDSHRLAVASCKFPLTKDYQTYGRTHGFLEGFIEWLPREEFDIFRKEIESFEDPSLDLAPTKVDACGSSKVTN